MQLYFVPVGEYKVRFVLFYFALFCFVLEEKFKREITESLNKYLNTLKTNYIQS